MLPEPDELHSACELPLDRLPRREVLRLDDGYETCVFVHDPRGERVGAPVVYLHGIQSHPGWFVGSAAALADAGHAVWQVARRGSGSNEADRGHARSARQLLQDTEIACRLAAVVAGPKVHLVGVSWGGKLATAYAAWARRGVEIASLTLVAPGIVPRVDVPFATKLAVAASLLLCPRKRFAIPLNDVELFTSNESKRQYLRDDPLRLHEATAQFLYASWQLDGMLRNLPAGCLTMPVTLLLARRDRIIDNATTLAAVQRLAGGRARVEEFDADHTLEFEPAPQPLHRALARAVGAGE